MLINWQKVVSYHGSRLQIADAKLIKCLLRNSTNDHVEKKTCTIEELLLQPGRAYSTDV